MAKNDGREITRIKREQTFLASRILRAKTYTSKLKGDTRMKANLMDGTVFARRHDGAAAGSFRALGVTGAAVAAGMRFGQTALAVAGSSHKKIDRGDADILRFLAAAELIETDFWQQYNELVAGNAPYGAALANLDEDMAVYVATTPTTKTPTPSFLTPTSCPKVRSRSTSMRFARCPAARRRVRRRSDG